MSRLDIVNSLWFLGWLAALLVLFALAVRLPLQPRLRRLAAQMLDRPEAEKTCLPGGRE